VMWACAESGPEVVWLASEHAAYGAKFSPTLLSGKPVRVTGTITFNFVAQ
jgi:hypothetical protein